MNRIYETWVWIKSDWIMTFYILRHQMVQYPTVNNNADLEFFSTPQCKVRNSSYEFAVISKNKILRDFWETQSLKNGLNRRFWKKITSLWLRHLRFKSLYLCQWREIRTLPLSAIHSGFFFIYRLENSFGRQRGATCRFC